MGGLTTPHAYFGCVAQFGRAAISKVAGRGFDPLRTRIKFIRGKGMSVGQKVSPKILADSQKKTKKSFLQEMKDEMKKVSWTSKSDLKVCTKIVLGSTFVLGFGIYSVDLVIKNFIDLLRIAASWLA